MKRLYDFYKIFLSVIIISLNLHAQDLNVQDYIGKTQKDVIAKFGNPSHMDNSTPSMICLFYKSPSMVFVSDETEIYQAEITKVYSSENFAKMELDDLIKYSLSNGFDADTTSNSTYVLYKEGIKTDIQFTAQEEKGLFCLKVKALRYD